MLTRRSQLPAASLEERFSRSAATHCRRLDQLNVCNPPYAFVDMQPLSRVARPLNTICNWWVGPFGVENHAAGVEFPTCGRTRTAATCTESESPLFRPT